MSAYTQNFFYAVGKKKQLDYDPSLITKERLEEIKRIAAQYLSAEDRDESGVKTSKP